MELLKAEKHLEDWVQLLMERIKWKEEQGLL